MALNLSGCGNLADLETPRSWGKMDDGWIISGDSMLLFKGVCVS